MPTTNLFETIQGHHWKEALSRKEPNLVSQQIQERILQMETGCENKPCCKDSQSPAEWDSHQFITQFNRVSKEIFDTAQEKGWHDKPRSDAEAIMLAVCELAEGIEGLRAGNPPSDKIGTAAQGGFSQIEEEVADCFIRLMDLSTQRGWRVAEAMEAKRAYNLGRAYRHGKVFRRP
jgi:NTP pyrophosphatase (non-canonical NTP hydrolase)